MDDLNTNVVGDIYGDNGCALDESHSVNNAIQNYFVDICMGIFMVTFVIFVALCYVFRINGTKLLRLLSWGSKDSDSTEGTATTTEVSKDA